jgi:hypothetical protein
MKFTKWEDLTEYQQLLSMYSDAYKDVYGVRPRCTGLRPPMTVEELKTQLEHLEAIIIEQIKAERG